MAAFAPLATYSFIHWAGDQGQSALYAVQQGAAGPSAIKERMEQAQRWAAFDFTGSRSQAGPGPVVGGNDESGDEQHRRSGQRSFYSGTAGERHRTGLVAGNRAS